MPSRTIEFKLSAEHISGGKLPVKHVPTAANVRREVLPENTEPSRGPVKSFPLLCICFGLRVDVSVGKEEGVGTTSQTKIQKKARNVNTVWHRKVNT
jgi:hypothetical protein